MKVRKYILIINIIIISPRNLIQGGKRDKSLSIIAGIVLFSSHFCYEN